MPNNQNEINWLKAPSYSYHNKCRAFLITNIISKTPYDGTIILSGDNDVSIEVFKETDNFINISVGSYYVKYSDGFELLISENDFKKYFHQNEEVLSPEIKKDTDIGILSKLRCDVITENSDNKTIILNAVRKKPIHEKTFTEPNVNLTINIKKGSPLFDFFKVDQELLLNLTEFTEFTENISEQPELNKQINLLKEKLKEVSREFEAYKATAEELNRTYISEHNENYERMMKIEQLEKELEATKGKKLVGWVTSDANGYIWLWGNSLRKLPGHWERKTGERLTPEQAVALCGRIPKWSDEEPTTIYK